MKNNNVLLFIEKYNKLCKTIMKLNMIVLQGGEKS